MKKIYLLAIPACILVFAGWSLVNSGLKAEGEGSDVVTGALDAPREEEPSQTSTYRPFTDNSILYEDEESDSVVTMYLTVTSGNSTENTDHTWNEVNGHSVYYYEDLGIERFGVNGLLQVGDEMGPLAGELGYGQVTPNATVTIRGQSSSENVQKNYKIKLNDRGDRWNGQKVINLNKHQSEGLRFRNKLMYKLMEKIPGMISLKTQFVHLYVKDETEGENSGFQDYGLYTQVEQPNKSFLERHGLDKNGQLYKLNMFEFFRYEDVIMPKNDSDYDENRFEELLEIKGNDDHSKLIAMLEDVNDSSVSAKSILEEWFDKDNVLNWLAFNILTGNIDTQSRNTLIYSPLNENRWYFINWDCDAGFFNTEYEIRGIDTNAGWEHGISNYWGNMLFRKILKDEDIRKELNDKIDDLKAILTREEITSLTERYRAVAEPFAYGKTDALYEPLTPSQYNQVCEALPGEMEENYDYYVKSLENPMPFFIGIPVRSEQGIHFSWEVSYDFQEDNIFYTVELADNPDMEHPVLTEEKLFTTEYDYQGSLEPGQYFVRVKAVDENGNWQYAFDYYVTNESQKNYGVKCFYVMPDGSIQEEGYE